MEGKKLSLKCHLVVVWLSPLSPLSLSSLSPLSSLSLSSLHLHFFLPLFVVSSADFVSLKGQHAHLQNKRRRPLNAGRSINLRREGETREREKQYPPPFPLPWDAYYNPRVAFLQADPPSLSDAVSPLIFLIVFASPLYVVCTSPCSAPPPKSSGKANDGESKRRAAAAVAKTEKL